MNIILIIILILLLFLINKKQNFYSNVIVVNRDGSLKDNIEDNYELKKIYYTLRLEKPTLTLFYDPNNQYSRAFYNPLSEAFYNPLSEPISDEPNPSNPNEPNPSPSYEPNPDETWNQIKNLYAAETKHPLLNSNFMNIEEIECSRDNISSCIDNCISQYSSNCGRIKYFSGQNTDTLRQPLRELDLVDKLPFVILSYMKYDEDGKLSTYINKYDGLYNYNDRYMPVSYNNLIDFINKVCLDNLKIPNINEKRLGETVHRSDLKDKGIDDHSLHTLSIQIDKGSDIVFPYSSIWKCALCSEFIGIY